MAARPGRLSAGQGRRRGAAEARILLLLWFAGVAVQGAEGTEPPLKCDELRLGQYPEGGRGRGRVGGRRRRRGSVAMAMGPGKAEGLAASRPGPGLPEGGERLPSRLGWRGKGEAEGVRCLTGCQGKPRVRSPEGGLSWKERERARLQRPRFLSRVVQCVPVCRFGVSRRFATRRSHGRRDPSPPPLHLLIFCRTLE